MSLVQQLGPHLPFLRRYARALTGTQKSGDSYVKASLQALAAIKLLVGEKSVDPLLVLDLWDGRFKTVALVDARRVDCPTCVRRRFQFLDSPDRDMTARLCGRDAVQVRTAASKGKLSLPRVAERLRGAGQVQQSPYMVRCQLEDGKMSLTVFEDGRALVKGTTDPGRARSVVARYLGA